MTQRFFVTLFLIFFVTVLRAREENVGRVLPDQGQAATPAARPAPLPYTGVSIAGGDFDHPQRGKTSPYGTKYVYPSSAELTYFASKGVNVIRFPFHWENLQPELAHPLDTADLGRIKAVVKEATGKGMTVLLDPHNYARYHGKVIGGPEVSNDAFADFWGKLAAEFRDNPRVWFGLMNEPFGLPGEQWLASANAAIAAIRGAGADNLILVPGISWTGAHSWKSSGNAVVMLGIVDPKEHYCIEVHQYLDTDSSGSKAESVSPTIGSERLREFTLWCREHHRQAFLGEFAAGDNAQGALAIDDMLGDMESNRDVWLGYAWWAAGAWWGDYIYTVEPKGGKDAPLFSKLIPHLQR